LKCSSLTIILAERGMRVMLSSWRIANWKYYPSNMLGPMYIINYLGSGGIVFFKYVYYIAVIYKKVFLRRDIKGKDSCNHNIWNFKFCNYFALIFQNYPVRLRKSSWEKLQCRQLCSGAFNQFGQSGHLYF